MAWFRQKFFMDETAYLSSSSCREKHQCSNAVMRKEQCVSLLYNKLFLEMESYCKTRKQQ